MKKTDSEHHAPLLLRRETHWYVFLHDDPRANEIVTMNYGGVGHEDRLRREVLCDDGRVRNFWCGTYSEAMAIKKASHYFGFSATVFTRQGSGKPRKWIDPAIARRRETLRKRARLLED